MVSNRKMLVFLGIALYCFLTVKPAFAADNVYYVDVAKLFDEYEKTKDNDRVLQEKGRKKEEERDAIVHEVRKLKDEIVLLNDDAKAGKQQTLEVKVRELQEFDNMTKQELGLERQKIVQEIFKDIDDAVKRFGERKGADMIFNDRALLYHNPKYDITTEMLKEINTGYSKNKKK